MSLFTEDQLVSRVKKQRVTDSQVSSAFWDETTAKAKVLLSRSLNEQRTFSSSPSKTYDIFLSHSSEDAKLVAGLKLELEDLGYSVYVDWIEDTQLDRKNVNKQTALLLQQRMKQCHTLIYAFSENASNSKWMPWELGYFDGIKGKVAVLPISKTSKSTFVGTEYLGIYYYIQVDTILNTNQNALWIHETASKYIKFDSWKSGSQPIQR